MKTIGQIAREAMDALQVDYKRTFDQQADEWWEAAAQAVRAAVIDEIASMWHDPENEHAKAIRALKDKR